MKPSSTEIPYLYVLRQMLHFYTILTSRIIKVDVRPKQLHDGSMGCFGVRSPPQEWEIAIGNNVTFLLIST